MAAPLKFCFLPKKIFSCLSSSSVVHVLHKSTHVVNLRRTKAEIMRTLRRKPNFLHYDIVDKHRLSPPQREKVKITDQEEINAPRDYRYVLPEFMPNPDFKYRDRVLEKLERQDMLRRRAVLDIPEFYVGSIMAVTVSDPHSPGKQTKFVGICIARDGQGLHAHFILRNVVDGLGVEIMYQMYNPTVLSVEVLKLEKRLDDQLYYLRNCPLEYSTFDFNMEPVLLPRGTQVPVNNIKVKLNAKPWECRWERLDLKGIEPLEVTEKMMKGIIKSASPWKMNDLMIDYRSKVNEDEEEKIMSEIYAQKQKIDVTKRVGKATLKTRR